MQGPRGRISSMASKRTTPTPSKRTTPLKGTPKAALKGKAALIKFLGIDPTLVLSKEDKDNYNGWVEWMKGQVRILQPAARAYPLALLCSAWLSIRIRSLCSAYHRRHPGGPEGADCQGL